MATHPSVIKRHRQSLVRKVRNTETMSRLRTLIKKARLSIESKNQDDMAGQLKQVNKALDKAVTKGIIKRNTASRWFSRLSRSANRTTAS